MNRFSFVLTTMVFTLILGCADRNVNDVELEEGSTENANSENIVIEYNNSGGMSPISEHIFISNDSACWKYGRYSEEIILSWQPSQSDLQSIIQVLEDNNYTKIESEKKQEVYDRGGVHIEISYKNEMVDLNNSGLSFVKEQWRDNFTAIKICINDYAQGEVQKQLLTLKFEQDQSAKNSNEPIRVWLNNQLFYDSEEQQNSPPKTISLYPGINTYDWTLYYADSVSYNNRPVRKNTGESKINAGASSQTITLEKLENEVILNID